MGTIDGGGAALALDLPCIERELAAKGFRLGFADPMIERAYTAEHRERARMHNRIVIAITVALFDAFYIPERHVLPEALGVSAILRFLLLTPVALLYITLDWRGTIARWGVVTVPALLIAHTLFAAIESLWVTNPAALANYQAVPLLQLTVLTARVSLRQAMVMNACACALYIATIMHSAFVPHELLGSLIATDITVGIATFAFAWRLDKRDRQVFLFAHQAEFRREILVRQNLRLEHLSQVDALTGLGNRRRFDNVLAALWAPGAESRPVSLVMFDIDCFKLFNDRYGHQAGDECLAMVARVISRCLRGENDTLVRYGGEEFALILPGASLEDGLAVAERVRRAVIERAIPHPDAGPADYVTISLGVATGTTISLSAAVLIEAADRCLYCAKRGGRNRVVALPPNTPDTAGRPAIAIPAQTMLLSDSAG